RKNCAAKLADRSRQIAALGFSEVVRREAPVFPAEPSVTRSIGLREGSVRIGRGRRRRWPVALISGALLGIGGAVAVFALTADHSAVVATAPADAPPSSNTDAAPSTDERAA